MKYYINLYHSVQKSSKVTDTKLIEEVITLIQDKNSRIAHNSIKARKALEDNNINVYRGLKLNSPTATVNFLFNKFRRNTHALKSTNLIFLDVDGDIELHKHELIFISGKSFSNQGRFYIIKAKGLNIENFTSNINLLAKQLPFNIDPYAIKITQQWILPYNKELYINNNSKVWIAKNLQSNSENNKITDRTKLCSSPQPIRYNNIDEIIKEINFNGDAAYDYGKPKDICEIKIPSKILAGKRNTVLNAIAYMLRALNPQITFNTINSLLNSINNKYCSPKYPKKDLNIIVQNIYKIPVKDLKLISNSKKRIFFNPDYDLSGKEKRKIASKMIGKAKREKTLSEIFNIINTWNFEKFGKITYKQLAVLMNKHTNTIIRYKNHGLSQKMKELNQNWLKKK